MIKHTQTLPNQPTGSTDYVTRHSYNQADGVTQTEYPSSTVAAPRKVSYPYSQAARLLAAKKGELTSTVYYASSAVYWADGAMRQVTLGNLLVETRGQNARGQMTDMMLGLSAGTAEKRRDGPDDDVRQPLANHQPDDSEEPQLSRRSRRRAGRSVIQFARSP